MSRTRTLLYVAAIATTASLLAIPDAKATEPADSVGVVDQSQGLWFLRDPASGQTTSFYFGDPGDSPIMGDWDCTGTDTPGLYRQSDGYVYLRNDNSQGNSDVKFFFGDPGDVPLAGDFNDDGCDTVSIYRPSEAKVYVINSLGSNDVGIGSADFSFSFGDVGDKPLTGDFNGDGTDTIGLHRESDGFVYYRDTLTTGNAHVSFFYGDAGDQILAGDWAQNPTRGPDTVGIFRPTASKFYLRFTNTQGNADTQFYYGNRSTVAVAGSFGNLPGGDSRPPSTVGPAIVTAVIDGDTFDISVDGVSRRVRIIGIDAPGDGECLYQEAKDHLSSLISGKTVTLNKDVSETDGSGSLLRYVAAPLTNPNGIVDVNLSLLTHGLAATHESPPDIARASEFAVTETVAKEAGRGVWGDQCDQG